MNFQKSRLIPVHRLILPLTLLVSISACSTSEVPEPADDHPPISQHPPVKPTETVGIRVPATEEEKNQAGPRPVPPAPPTRSVAEIRPAPASARNEADATTSSDSAVRLSIAKQMAGMEAQVDVRGLEQVRAAHEPLDRESYTHFDINPVHRVRTDPISTFSIDVDTASYSNVRRWLNDGSLPQQDAVRVEELINYFSYQYPVPDGKDPFAIYTEVGPSPWHAQRRLLHIGIKGQQPAENPAANLVFLIDVSGSMQSQDKLGLLKSALKLLTAQLDSADRIAIAVYAGAAGAVLSPTAGDQRAVIAAAIDSLTAGGSTNGGAGIALAYSMARQNFLKDGVNRIILATDGDFNVGTTDQQALKNLVEAERKSGVALTVLGFGSGNYNDSLMQELAQNGNGNAAYIDTLSEARKVLVDELAATLHTIASDVKIQVEFNPATVSEYRLVGYETRHLEREDFNNDAVDAGDIGAGHSVTALYEITLVEGGGHFTDPLRYRDPSSDEGRNPDQTDSQDRRTANAEAELAFVKLRYKAPGSQSSRLLTQAVHRNSIASTLAATSDNFRFSAAVSAFGQLLRGGEHTGSFGYAAAAALAAGARGEDAYGYRGEFLNLVRTADALAASQNAAGKVDAGETAAGETTGS